MRVFMAFLSRMYACLGTGGVGILLLFEGGGRDREAARAGMPVWPSQRERECRAILPGANREAGGTNSGLRCIWMMYL